MQENNWQRRTYLKAGGAAITTSLLAGCAGDGGNGGGGGDGGDEGEFSGTIKAGFITALSGAYARLGNLQKWGNELATQRINNNGGINGNKLEVIYRDSQLDPSNAVSTANELIRNEDIDLLSGPTASSVALALMPVAERNNVLNTSAGTAARSITGADCNRVTYRLRSHAEVQALALAPQLRDRGYESASIIYADYAWGQSEDKWFTEVFESEGGTVKSSVGAPLGTSDYSSYISKLDQSADALFMALGGNDAVNFLNQAKDFGLNEKMRISGLGAALGSNLENVVNVAEGLLMINYYPARPIGPLDNKANRKFHEDFKEIGDGSHPTRIVTPGYEFLNAVKEVGDEVGFNGKDDLDAMLDGLDGFEMEESYRFPQGSKYIRGDDNQAMLKNYMTEVTGGELKYLETIPVDISEQSQILCEL